MPCGGLTPFLLLQIIKTWYVKVCVNALWRANSISTDIDSDVTIIDKTCVNALWRANSISTTLTNDLLAARNESVNALWRANSISTKQSCER